jgi:cation:H+ antiporter
MDIFLFISIMILVIAFYALVKSANLLISTSSIIGEKLGLSKFVIGLTIVAIGTSLPELFTSISGLFNSNESTSFIIGTILGSNITNLLFIFGVLLVFSVNFDYKISKLDLVALSISTFILLGLIYFHTFFIIQGIIFLMLYITYLFYDIKRKGKNKYSVENNENEFTKELKKYNNIILGLLLTLSLIGLNYSSKGVVFGIELLGQILNIPVTYLTLTTVALATSLPEAVVTYSSAKSREFDLAIGNIIGSNISNVFFIGGIIGLFKQFSFDNSGFIHSSIYLIFATIIFIFYLNKKKLKKYNGSIVLSLYILYLLTIFLI